jgi:Fe-S cluster assembly protein SufB
LNEDIVRAISMRKEEPQWMTDWRIESFRAWQEMTENGLMYTMQNQTFKRFPIIQHQKVDPNKTLDDVDPELLEMYKKVRHLC